MIYKFALAQSKTKEMKQIGYWIFICFYYEKSGRQQVADGFTF
jgi:hypothetical protein